jgi:hypothetical protein
VKRYRFVALCTLLVVMSGAAVTSSNGHYKNIHLVAGIADILLIASLRRWSVLALAAVEATIGWFGASGPVTGTLHACLAAVLFAWISVSPSITCPEQVQDYGRPSLRTLSAMAAFLVLVQVGFGAGFRHSAVGILPHLLGALIVALFIVIVGAFVSTQFPKHATLRPLAVWLMTVTGIQVFLGLTAFLMRLMNMQILTISVAHVAVGNLTLAVTVMLAVEIRRCVVGGGAVGAVNGH